MLPATALLRRHRAGFGRRTTAIARQRPTFGDDLRLFATFFLGGLTFMSVYLA